MRRKGFYPLCTEHRPLTEEHVIPQWMLRDMNDRLDGPPSPPSENPVTEVCGNCNQWMNRRFEIPAKPLLVSLRKGETRKFTTQQQLRLAGWVTKTLIMSSIATTPARQHGPTPDFLLFRKTGKPLAHTRVYLARVDHTKQDLAAGSTVEGASADGTTDPVVGLMLIIEELGLCVFFRPTDLQWPERFERECFRTSLRRIYPTQGPWQWPPAQSLSKRELADVFIYGLTSE